MLNIDNIKKYNHIHMRGIGGVSMSGIAEILNHWGILVTGSDDTRSDNTDKLQNLGIDVTIGTNIDGLSTSDLLIYTPAMREDDIELITAKNLNIPLIERADFLGLITKVYKNAIGVSGTHGKTTTTSMLSLCFIEGELDPTIQVGGTLKQINGNNRTGNSDIFIIEACEYVESFLKFDLKDKIILNIDNDHLDYFKTFDRVKEAFAKYVSIMPEDGILVINADDDDCLNLANHTKASIITYGITNTDANFIAKNMKYDQNGFAVFDVYKNNEFYETMELSIPGLHNVSNSLSCIALCDAYNIPKEKIKTGIKKFTGTHRRFEYIGCYNDVAIFDDYGHHPTEIEATYHALAKKKYNKSWVVFQPHTYNRTKELLDEFANSLKNFDNIIITDIYTARGQKEDYVSSQDLVDKIKYLGKEALYIKDFEDIVEYVRKNTKPNDIVLTLGAGTIGDLGSMII